MSDTNPEMIKSLQMFALSRMARDVKVTVKTRNIINTEDEDVQEFELKLTRDQRDKLVELITMIKEGQ